eukprot:4077727-Prymnesium_polylepis.1
MRVRLVNDSEVKGQELGEDEEDDCHFLKKLEHNMLTTLSLRGVENIKRVFMREPKRETVDPATGAVKMVTEWVLDTEGVNMME